MPRPTRTAKKAKPAARTPTGWLVYILRCGDGSLYTGSTNDLEKRLVTHNAGKGAAYTRSRLPVKVVFREPAADRSAALRREAAIKKLTRAQKLALVRAGSPTASSRASSRASARA